jgi:hypothetical protein
VDLTSAKTFATPPSPLPCVTDRSTGLHAASSTILRATHCCPPCQAPLPPPIRWVLALLFTSTRGSPRNYSLHRPQKAKAGDGGSVAPIGDGLVDLKSKIEGEQEIAAFVLKSPNSGMRFQSLLICGARFNTMNKYIPLSANIARSCITKIYTLSMQISPLS